MYSFNEFVIDQEKDNHLQKIEDLDVNEIVKTGNYKRVSIQISEKNELEDLFHVNVNIQLNESLIKRVVGGAVGLALGKKIAKAVAKALGISPSGVLYKTMTSRAVLTAIGASFGKD